MIPNFIEKHGGENGEYVRLDGNRCKVVKTALGKREYLRLKDGTTFALDRADQIVLANKGRLTTDAAWDKLAANYAEILERDWSPGCFSEAEMASAYYRKTFLQVLDVHDARERRKRTVILAVINRVKGDNTDIAMPSVEAVRKWDERWLITGRDIRVLADRNSQKGSFGQDRRYAWIDEMLESGIDTYMNQSPYWSAAELFKHMEPKIEAEFKDGAEIRGNLRPNGYFGINRIYTLRARRNQTEQALREKGLKEARRSTKGYASGPSGDCALHEVEVDHHMLDIDVVGQHGEILGRPWITAMIDRYSRMIVGIYITLEPPSWFSVMMCLRVAVVPKEDFLATLPYEFTRPWDCFGTMDILYMDRAAEFRCSALRAASSVLNILLVDVPRARGDLKGKIERWFGTYEGQISKLPGHKGSRPDKRIEETAVPKLTLADVQLVSTAWAVDIYNYERHSEIGEKPAERFQKSLDESLILKLPPPVELLGPATSLAKEVTLTSDGVRFDNLHYKSDELQKLWHKVGNRRVFARPDEDDATLVIVHDGGKKWIEAHLQGKYADIQMTRVEFDRKRKVDKVASIDTPAEHEKAMRARANYGKLIDDLVPRKGKPKVIKPQSKPAKHLHRPRLDREASAAPITGYSSDKPVVSTKYDGLGPFHKPSVTQKVLEGQVIKGSAKAVFTETHVPPPQPSAMSASEQLPPPATRVPRPTKSDVVKPTNVLPTMRLF